jgi:hypothetical protein
VRARNDVGDRLGDLALARPVVAQTVRLIGNDQIPCAEQGPLVPLCELVRADQHLSLSTSSVGEQSGLRLRIEDAGRDEELLEQLLFPLLTQARRRHDQDVAATLGPVLRDDDARLDRLTEAHLVREDHTRQERGLQREKRRVDLMRLRLDLSVEQKSGELADVIAGVTAL